MDCIGCHEEFAGMMNAPHEQRIYFPLFEPVGFALHGLVVLHGQELLNLHLRVGYYPFAASSTIRADWKCRNSHRFHTVQVLDGHAGKRLPWAIPSPWRRLRTH